MRYRIVVWNFPTGYHVIVTESVEHWQGTETTQSSLFIPFDDVKVDDLMHILGELHRRVAESTP